MEKVFGDVFMRTVENKNELIKNFECRITIHTLQKNKKENSILCYAWCEVPATQRSFL